MGWVSDEVVGGGGRVADDVVLSTCEVGEERRGATFACGT